MPIRVQGKKQALKPIIQVTRASYGAKSTRNRTRLRLAVLPRRITKEERNWPLVRRLSMGWQIFHPKSAAKAEVEADAEAEAEAGAEAKVFIKSSPTF